MLASKRDIDTKFTITIERILFIILLHAIIPSIFIIIYLNLGQREAARKTFENNLVQITQFAAHSFEKEFLKTKAMLQVLSSLPEIRAHNKKACEEISRTLLNADTDQVYTTIGAIDKTGNIYCNPVPLAQKINVSDRDYFQQVSKNQRFTTGGYSIGRLSGSKLIVAAYPIFDKNETFDGMVGAAMDVRWLEKIAEKVKLPPGYTFTTIDQNGIIVARHPYVENLIGTDSKQRALGKAIFSTSQKEGIFTAQQDWIILPAYTHLQPLKTVWGTGQSMLLLEHQLVM